MRKRRKKTKRRTAKPELLKLFKGSIIFLLLCTVIPLLYIRVTNTPLTTEMVSSIVSLYVSYIVIALLTIIVYNIFLSKSFGTEVEKMSLTQLLDLFLYFVLCGALYVNGILVAVSLLLLKTGWTPP